MRAGPHLFDAAARVAVYAGAGAVDDGDGDVRLKLVHPLQHRPRSPAARNAHILKGGFPTVTIQKDSSLRY